MSRQVEGILIDTYTAGSSKSLFKKAQLRAVNVLYYPRSYGIVMSGDMAGVAGEARDYIAANQQQLFDLINSNTERLEVK